MKVFLIILIAFCFIGISCNKTDDRPKSKTDYIPILSAASPKTIKQGEPINSRVTCGFDSHWADIRFLNFEVKETQPLQFEIRAMAFYDNILYGVSLPVLSRFDTTMVLQTPKSGQYLLKFYSFNQPVQTDTVLVN
jgi:hypothetical protein